MRDSPLRMTSSAELILSKVASIRQHLQICRPDMAHDDLPRQRRHQFPQARSVYQALDPFARQSLANPGRAGHKMALAAERALDDCRHLLNQFFHGKGRSASSSRSTAPTRSTWRSRACSHEGDHVITTDLEHNSVSRPLRAMELAGRITPDARRRPTAAAPSIPTTSAGPSRRKTRLVALTHASNVLGTVQPIAEIGRIARERDLLFLVDAAQTAGVVPIDVQAMHIDLLAFPGHKSLLGPTGTGALYVGPRATVRAWREGGTGGDSSSETQPREFPYFLEGGTPNVLGVAGLAAGIRYVQEHGLDDIHAPRGRRWSSGCGGGWTRCGGYEVFGHRDHARRVGTLSFRSEALPAAELGGILDQAFDIAIRPGLHCAPYIHRALGTFPDGTVRVSPGPFNTEEDIDLALAEALAEIKL